MSDPTSHGPPADTASSELWSKLITIPRPWEVVDFPRMDPITKEPIGKLAIWCLTQEEQIASAAAADRVAKQLLKEGQKNGEENLGYQDVYRNEATVQVLHRACRDVNDIARPAFPAPGLLRKQLTTDEIGVLAVLYMQVQFKIGPIVARMSPDEEKEWIRRLADGGQVFPTSSLSPREQERLLSSMASQLVSFWTATSSAGSRPEAPTSSSESPAETLPDTTPDAIPME